MQSDGQIDTANAVMPLGSDAENLARSNFDLRNIYSPSLIVTGFFTPNYRPLAQSFSKNLSEHCVSHHIYALARITGDWVAQTRQKPSALAAAMRDYPGQTLVLMDVDCKVRGDISDLFLLETRHYTDSEAQGDEARRSAASLLARHCSEAYKGRSDLCSILARGLSEWVERKR